VASKARSGGAGFLIGGFAQKMFELRPKNTAGSPEKSGLFCFKKR